MCACQPDSACVAGIIMCVNRVNGMVNVCKELNCSRAHPYSSEPVPESGRTA